MAGECGKCGIQTKGRGVCCRSCASLGRNKGRVLTKEHKDKIIKGLEAVKQQISISLKEKWKNLEYRKHMSAVHKGQTSWNKGRKETRPEVLKRLSDSHIGIVPWNKGLVGAQNSRRKGMTYEEIYGTNKGKKMRRDMSASRMGLHISPDTEMKKGMTGNKSIAYKHGLTPLGKLIRSSDNYNKWRINVFERDGYLCTVCSRGGYLEVHHINSFSNILKSEDINSIDVAFECDKLWDEDNGLTMCKSCHGYFDPQRYKTLTQNEKLAVHIAYPSFVPGGVI